MTDWLPLPMQRFHQHTQAVKNWRPFEYSLRAASERVAYQIMRLEKTRRLCQFQKSYMYKCIKKHIDYPPRRVTRDLELNQSALCGNNSATKPQAEAILLNISKTIIFPEKFWQSQICCFASINYVHASILWLIISLVCPYCSNTLTVSRSPSNDEFPSGQNRLECRTCPYQYLINQRWFERKEMKRKEVDDVLGGKDAWANVDKTDGV